MTKPKKCKSATTRADKPQKSQDYIPVTVPFAAILAGETPTIDQWAHRAVWTDRMLETLLQNKVKGARWHTLSNQRWPNAYFTEHGFVSLNELHLRFVQSTGTY